ncbi:MAG: tRNA lysidine(34) synthetase TilS [Ruminococcaceae bacterium]|nr:tRNA lysidine(34) synthetase TilS [Oscillospiraceae bacterium]
MLDKIRKALSDFSMLGEQRRILVALSGGKDSVALLYALVLLREELSLSLFACHVNHRIREESETAKDIALCEHLCRKWKVPLSVDTVDIPKLSGGKGIEECARIHRYRLLREAADGFCADRIATAHTSTDSAETMLFHLLRGTAADGLCGIPPVRSDGIIRPLILCTEADVVAFCREHALPFRTDSTNSDSSYTRNFLRNEVSPLLRKVNPSFEDAFASLAASLRLDRAYFHDALPPFSEDRDLLASLPPAILSRLLKREYDARFHGELSCRHIESMMRLLASDCAEEKRLSLPGGVCFLCAGKRARFLNGHEQAALDASPDTSFCLPLSMGEHRLPNGACLLLTKEADSEDVKRLKNIYNLFIHQAVKSEGEVGKMLVRLRADGDRYRFGGLTRSVKKCLQAKKLPLALRKHLPVLCDENGIFWIPFLPPRDGSLPEKNRETLNIFYFYG